jgi:hypothetical protein
MRWHPRERLPHPDDASRSDVLVDLDLTENLEDL